MRAGDRVKQEVVIKALVNIAAPSADMYVMETMRRGGIAPAQATRLAVEGALRCLIDNDLYLLPTNDQVLDAMLAGIKMPSVEEIT